MKVDLSKAFDRVNWLYLRILLNHLGFPFSFIKWITGCISNIPFNVLVSGSATPFFTSARGLRQGCPLSPLLFLLVMEGFSRIISEDHRWGRLKGINIVENCILRDLLFVDNVLVFLSGSVGDITSIRNIFSLFQKATGMLINEGKSTLMVTTCFQHEINYVLDRFHFTQLELVEGLKYLGYKLKPIGYNIADWT